MKILVSKCLLGENCRYKGDNCKNDKVLALSAEHELIGVCPEVMGGLPTPRLPGERVGEKVLSSDGTDVTAAYVSGAEEALSIARRENVDYCILKAKSPSCGKGMIYDGSFSGKMTSGNGVAAALLIKHGFRVLDENDL